MEPRRYPDLAQLLIVLEAQGLPIWRRVHLSFFTKLGGLHRVVQAVMGWDDRLPHRFILAGDIYDRAAHGEALDAGRERNWRLDSALYPDKIFWYVYGADDKWRHRIVMEEYLEREPRWRYPRCIGGAGASPPNAREPFNLGAVNRRLWRALRKH
jgi:Plasmid pRiA4b ORF-3-like protein